MKNNYDILFSYRHGEDRREAMKSSAKMRVVTPKSRSYGTHNTRCCGWEVDLSFVQFASRAASAFFYKATLLRNALAMTDARGKNVNTLSLRNKESGQLLNSSLKGFNLNSPGQSPGNIHNAFTEPRRGSTPKMVWQLHSPVQPLRGCNHPFNCYPPVLAAAIQIEARRASIKAK